MSLDLPGGDPALELPVGVTLGKFGVLLDTNPVHSSKLNNFVLLSCFSLFSLTSQQFHTFLCMFDRSDFIAAMALGWEVASCFHTERATIAYWKNG